MSPSSLASVFLDASPSSGHFFLWREVFWALHLLGLPWSWLETVSPSGCGSLLWGMVSRNQNLALLVHTAPCFHSVCACECACRHACTCAYMSQLLIPAPRKFFLGPSVPRHRICAELPPFHAGDPCLQQRDTGACCPPCISVLSPRIDQAASSLPAPATVESSLFPTGITYLFKGAPLTVPK